MPVVFESIGLEQMYDHKDIVLNWVGHASENGRVLMGYSGNFYLHTKYGNVEIYTHNDIKDDEEKVVINGFDAHVSGQCVWNIKPSGIDISDDSEEGFTKVLGVNSLDDRAFTIMHIINADILPSFFENDVIKTQVIAYATDVYYYKDEDELIEKVPEYNGTIEKLQGERIAPAMGTVLPINFLNNHKIDNNDSKEDYSTDDLVVTTGIVKEAYVKSVENDGNKLCDFISTIIKTQFGDLEIVHSIDMVSEEEIKLIKKESVIQAVCVVAGDAAIYEYDQGLVKDEKNDLMALRNVMINGNASRLKLVLSEDVVYESDNWDEPARGMEEVINRLDYVNNTTKLKFYSYLATLENSNPGERCIVLAENEKNNYSAIVRIKVNDDGMITNILVSKDPSIKFKLDQ